LINNRQTGRRRGRGGGGPRPNNAPSPGNRQDNRSRGNAAQLHEKYKAMARDAQLAGDRVQTEYYLQFADHYFRVLSEGRARFEEQRRPRDDYMSDEDEDQDQDEGVSADGDEPQDREDREDRFERQPRRDRFEGGDRGDRGDRGEREQRAERPERPERNERPVRAEREQHADRSEREQRNGDGRPRRERLRRERPQEDVQASEGDGEERIALDVLPPAISPDAGDGAKAPRRRTRRPRDGEEIAPAA
jgi:hypothetical protein